MSTEEKLDLIIKELTEVKSQINELKTETDKIQSIVEDVDKIENKSKSLTTIVSINLLASLIFDIVIDIMIEAGLHPTKKPTGNSKWQNRDFSQFTNQ